MALGNGKGYISITGARLKTLGMREGQTVELTLKADASEFGMKMSEELKALLEQDDEGRARFEKLTPAKQRYVIFYCNGVKNSDLRLERALLLIGNLKRLPVGKENFREMLGLGPREL